ncbi:TIGR00282 family metallophosphoesterase [Erysipelothrix rhusiopathiae]|uniref:TIGR00282 family metallophosphoesterase n=1 Tax=Erysipelothrix rhusiopathiae TaxID=1648 RepID=UPI002B24AFFC|nr:TIGR00282 family metallophosphoesterase [Erysipelothrix rhusiopathiae]WRB92576.1 TIGR00282 family metallophosphoesterase [Erysipelothrix rhusiopathiae]
MKILFIGDIVGASGRQIVVDHLPMLKEKYEIDFTIANGENSAHGKGITKKIYNQLTEAGVECITMGNHTFAKREIIDDYDECPNLLIPANIEPIDFGNYYKVFDVKGKQICVVNLYGEAFMNRVGDRPYPYMDWLLENTEYDYYFVDFHGESTSEKMLFAHIYSEEIDAMVGTHTHVQTADERIIGQVNYITDVGMCGACDSVIGRDIDELYDRVILNENTHFKVAKGDAFLNAVVIDVDDKTMKSKSIQRIAI